MAPLYFFANFKNFCYNIYRKNEKEVVCMLFEYIAIIYNATEDKKERKYGIVQGETIGEAMSNLDDWYGEDLICIEYFGTPAEDAEDTVYEFNNNFADSFYLSNRKFGRIIPPLNDVIE